MCSRYRLVALALIFILLMIGGCGKQQPSGDNAIGSANNPIKMALVPSLDTQKLVTDGAKLAKLLEKETGLKYEVSVPTSYTAVITAMGAGNVDIGWLSPIPYVIAHDRYGVEVVLTTVRDNSTKYWSFIIARKDSGIDRLADLKGKRFAFGDPLSTSGTIYAKHLFRSKGNDPATFFSNVIYAGSHDRVVVAVYNKQVDAGAIYGGTSDDARSKVLKAIPDVNSKTHVIAKSIEIPNDTVSVRKGLPPAITKKIADGLLKIAASDEGRKAILSLYGIDGFVRAKDADYESVRTVARAEDIKFEQIKRMK